MNPSQAKSTIRQIQALILTGTDGEWGPLSQRALDRVVQASLEHDAAPSGHPFIVAAAPWVGIREVSHNRFPGDGKLWLDCADYPDGWNDRQPYCAAFMCHVVASAVRAGAKVRSLPTTASVSAFRAWARAKGWTASKPQPGDMFTLLPSGTSHIGLVERVDGDVIHTIEANTGAAGERDGDGFWRKTRRISACDFIRIPVS